MSFFFLRGVSQTSISPIFFTQSSLLSSELIYSVVLLQIFVCIFCVERKQESFLRSLLFWTSPQMKRVELDLFEHLFNKQAHNKMCDCNNDTMIPAGKWSASVPQHHGQGSA